MVQVMTTNYKQVFILATGLTGIISSGICISKIPDVIIVNKQEEEKTKQVLEQEKTKQMQEQTKQMQEQIKQMQEQTKQIQLKRKWF